MSLLRPSQWIPNADIRNYYLYWFKDIYENCSKGFVGAIRNFSNEKTVIKIEIDDSWLIEDNQRNCALCINPKSYYDDCIIVISKAFFEEIINDSPKISFLWHEVGHFHTNHYFPEYSSSEQSSIRREYINKGTVYPAETVADLVSAYYEGIEQTVEALRQATRERHRLTQYGDTNASLAWWELRRRKKLYRNYRIPKKLKKYSANYVK